MNYEVCETVTEPYRNLGLVAKVTRDGKDVAFCQTFPDAQSLVDQMMARPSSGKTYTAAELEAIAAKTVNDLDGTLAGWQLNLTTTGASLLVRYHKLLPWWSPGLRQYDDREIEVAL